MDKKELIIAGIVVIIAVIVGSMVFAPNGDSKFTTIDVLNKGLSEKMPHYISNYPIMIRPP